MNKTQTQIWIRNDEGLQDRINDAAKSVGMLKADYVRKIIDYALDRHTVNPYFFVERGDCKHHTGKRKSR